MVYTVVSLLSLLLLLIAYCKNKRVLIVPAFALTAIRNVVRIIDFENSIETMNMSDWIRNMIF